MLQARQSGVLLRGEADYQLHLIFLWYEQKPAQALEILEGLDARYPTNPLFQRRIAEVQDENFRLSENVVPKLHEATLKLDPEKHFAMDQVDTRAYVVVNVLLNDRVVSFAVHMALGEPQLPWSFWWAPLLGMLLWAPLFLLLDALRLGRR